jgi:hypothetical protein
VVDVTEWLAVPYAGGHQLNDPAGTAPALTDRLGGIAGAEIPSHLAAVACLENADLDWEVPVPAELSNDLTQQCALVVLDRQEQVGALLGGELKNAGEVCSASAWIKAPSRSSVSVAP